MNSRERISVALLLIALGGCRFESSEWSAPPPDGGAMELDGGGWVAPPIWDDERPPFASHEDPTVRTTIAAWRERYLIHRDVASPDTAQCIDELAWLETAVVSRTELRRLCQRCTPNDTAPECEGLTRASGCATVGQLRDSDGELEESRPLLVVADEPGRDARTLQHLFIHEALHQLGLCSGQGSDEGHSRMEVWCIGGDACSPEEAAMSVQSRARAMLPDD